MCATLATAGALHADEALPELEFLEYLGSWAEDDEEWLLVAEATNEDKREAPRQTTSENQTTEKDDGKDESEN